MTPRTLLSLAALAALALPVPAEEAVKPAEPGRIDLALCLDTSNSMDGLIAAAKLKLWAIVNELAKAKPTPELRVALLSYGNNGYDAATGWVRKDLGFTQDLDQVYARLNALTTNGGDEYVARVVRDAAALDWTPSPKALKLVFVAGNEPAGQDPQLSVKDVFGSAIAKGIQVNTIFCGDPAAADAAGWREAAALADGQFACIDQDRGTVVVATPMDERLNVLSGRLNGTYLAFGREGGRGAGTQREMDQAAEHAAPAAAAERAWSKASGLYNNKAWDLVDACKEKGFDLKQLKDGDLPEEIRKLPSGEREAYVAKKAEERRAIQDEIQKLSEDREAYVEAEMKRTGQDGGKSLDSAIRRAIRAQAERKGMRFE